MAWFLVMNIILSIICVHAINWANFYLFTYLGEAEICGEWKPCYMYHTLTIPARVVAFLIPIFTMVICFTCWGFFFDIMGIC